MSAKLLTRDGFREAVYHRDHNRCVACGDTSDLDAHHLLERRLWPDGGYYLANGVTVCGPCHWDAETTKLSVERLRQLAGIREVMVPPHLFATDTYDKWGNEVLPNGNRLRGELFWDEPVQKVLEPILHLYGPYVKGPRTYHFPWSPGATSDDKTLSGTDQFVGMGVVVTAKMDGESTTIYGVDGFIHARSVSPLNSHPSRSRVKGLAQTIGRDIPQDWRLTGENLQAVHSISYQNLFPGDYWFFQVFNLWNDRNVCLPWAEVVEYAELLGLRTVPVLYEGPWDEALVRGLYQDTLDGDPLEGYVVRPQGAFALRDYRRLVGKYVRAGHVQTGDHWLHGPMVENRPRMG